MELYKSKYLTITKKNDILIQEWSRKELTPIVFKNEILIFLDIYKKYKPNGILWNQENFTLEFKESQLLWFDKEILKKEHINDMRRIAITVAKNDDVHLALVELFNTIGTFTQPHFFSNLLAAETFLETGYNKELYNPESISYKIVANGKNHTLSVQVGHNDLTQTLDALKLLKDNKIFAKKHKIKFELLTIKELEIFKLIVLGNTNKAIAVILFIEPSTVATHRKHIIKKLETNSFKDLYKYAKAFRVVRF